MIPQNDEDRRATAPHACDHKNEQEPFEVKGDSIKPNALRVHRRAQLIRQNLSQERPNCQRGEHEDRVKGPGGLGVAV